MANLARRGTIISPTGHIRSYALHRFSALVLAGSGLAFVAGYINTICIANFFQAPLSAATGTTSKMVIALAKGNFAMTLHLVLLIFSFVFGSSISAALVGGSSFRIQRPYGLVLLLESFAFAFGYLFEETELGLGGKSASLQVGAYFVSLGYGLQNGMCTTFSGAVIRTTHVTGILTDIGLILGQAIFHPRTRKHIWKLKVLVPLYIAFCVGGAIGWFAFEQLRSKAIVLPCALVGILGIAHLGYCIVIRMQEKRRANSKKWKSKSNESIRLTVPMIEIDGNANSAFDKQMNGINKNHSEDQPNEIEKTSEPQDPSSLQVVSVHDTKADVTVLS